MLHFLHTLGLPGIFLLLFFENMGLPLPTEAAYIVGQALISKGHVSYFLIFSVFQAGHMAGALSSYAVGRFFRSRKPEGPPEGQGAAQAQDKLDRWFTKYGTLTIFLSRLVGYVRPWSSYLAGAAKTPFWPFLFYTFLGTFVFNAISISVTGTLTEIWHRYPATRVAMSAFFVLSLFGVAAYEYIHRKHQKKQG